MPIIKITPDSPIYNEPPIFLIPGILGNGEELRYLWDNINESNNESNNFSPIYVLFQDNTRFQSLEEEAQHLGNEIFNICGSQNPCKIVGFSMGCIKAALTAKYMQKNLSTSAYLFLIDGPSPELIKAYFQKNPLEAINDMLEVVNYAAKLNDLKPITLTEKEKNSLISSSIDECFKFMENKTKNNNINAKEKYLQQFNFYINNANQNLQNTMAYTAPPYNIHKDRISSIKILMTRHTSKKYNNAEFLGWQNYTKRIFKFGENSNENTFQSDNTDLIHVKHMYLLTEDHTKQLTPSIIQFFDSETALFLLEKTSGAFLKLYNRTQSPFFLNLTQKYKQDCKYFTDNISPSSSPPKRVTEVTKPLSFGSDKDKESKVVIRKASDEPTLNMPSTMFGFVNVQTTLPTTPRKLTSKS